MNLFRKKNPTPISEKTENARRSFIRKSIAGAFGAAALLNATKVFSRDSKTGYVYVKQNGEVINNYKPMGDSSPYLGQITIFAFNYPPHNWAQCNGQLLSITQNTALFSLLGNYYGGNGVTNFALPDFRGRVPVGTGQGAGLTNYQTGDAYGTETVSLLITQMPAHNHSLGVNTGLGNSPNPSGKYIAENAEGINSYSLSPNTTLHAGSISFTGSGAAHNNIQPILVLNFCIAMQGIFPSHS